MMDKSLARKADPSDLIIYPFRSYFASWLPRNPIEANIGPECCLRIHGTTCGMRGSLGKPWATITSGVVEGLSFGSVAIEIVSDSLTDGYSLT